jgi:hypothetical protein
MIYFLVIILAAAVLMYAVIFTGAGQKSRSKGSSRGNRRRSGGGGSVDTIDIKARWDVIMATAGTGASGLKSAIGEADKLFDHAMRQLGYSGDTMADRLKSAKSKFSSYSVYDAVWRAHKLRNSLAHDVGFDLVVSQANEALRDFERGLKELGAL